MRAWYSVASDSICGASATNWSYRSYGSVPAGGLASDMTGHLLRRAARLAAGGGATPNASRALRAVRGSVGRLPDGCAFTRAIHSREQACQMSVAAGFGANCTTTPCPRSLTTHVGGSPNRFAENIPIGWRVVPVS